MSRRNTNTATIEAPESAEVEATEPQETEQAETEAPVVSEPAEPEEDSETEVAKELSETDTLLTPFECANVVNGWLKEQGVEKVLPKQMFYNYTTALVRHGQKSRIPVVVDENDKVFIRKSELATWFVGYFAKNHAPKVTEPAPEKEAADATA